LPNSPTLIALDRLLAGKHAAVFAYPLIVARVGKSRRDRAMTLWQAHRAERDELTERLVLAGLRPATAEAAYDVGTLPRTSARAAALAARVEGGLAALATDLLAAGQAGSEERSLGGDHLVLAARRAAGWTARPIPFPGRSAASAASSANAASTPTPT
jgi:hypothetical protein